jgi:serine/threonine protein kinase/Tol biopolymer transport system component
LDRDKFLASACAHDPALRREVESLLAHASPSHSEPQPVTAAEGLHSPRLSPGFAIGQYQIQSLLDVGGMGEVYRARDTILGRDVAIKILARDLCSDPARVARLEREARLLAALNHPHIAAIYGIAEQGDVRGLVLELVEGQTLADLLNGGPLGVQQGLRIADQIADALEAAHASGVIHRDIKPANIRVTPVGTVKLIDFGLGKAVAAVSDDSRAVLGAATRSGVILGTAAYMSPEQACGRAVDERTDIWSFGCVTFEMLAGHSPFEAGTPAEAIAKILTCEPDWHALPSTTPIALRRLLRRCLTKEPTQRLRNVPDARLELADALSMAEHPVRRIKSFAHSRVWMPAGALAVALALVGAWSTLSRARPSPSPSTFQFPIDVLDTGGLGVVASPDGRQIAFANFVDGAPQIWVHALESGVTRAVVGAAGGYMPFWSPDGRSLGFFELNGGLKRVDLANGVVTSICATERPFGGTWNADGIVVFSTDPGLFRVPAAGGTPVPVDIVDESDGPAARTFPQFLPDRRHFIYHSAGRHSAGVRVGSLDSPDTRALVETVYPAAFAPPSHLLFLRGTALVARRLNLKTLALDGEESVIAPDAAPEALPGPLATMAQFSASGTGVLAFMKARGGNASRLTWFDRTANPLSSIKEPLGGEYINPAISPDGRRVAVNRMEPGTGNWDIWVVDLSRNVASRMTFDPAIDADPVWSPDGTKIVFASNRGGRYALYQKIVDASEPETLVAPIPDPAVAVIPTDWSPDETFVIFTEIPVNGPWSTWVVSLKGDRAPFPVGELRGTGYAARFSPDGKWIAYSSSESGEYEVYVQRFLAAGEKKQISHGGGTHPRWTSGGRELVYWAVPGGVARVDVDLSGPTLRIGPSKPLITTPILNLIDGRTHYDATRDGQRFLLRQPVGEQRSAITVIVNWQAKLR